MKQQLLDRTKAPEIFQSVDFELNEPELYLLDNQIPVYYLSSNKHELIRIKLIFDAGCAFNQIKLQAESTLAMLNKGTSKYSAYKTAAEIDNYGAYLKFDCRNDQSIITLTCLKKNLQKLLPIIRSMISEATFSKKEFKAYLTRSIQSFLTNEQKSKVIASKHFSKLIFGENTPYGAFLESSDFDKIQINNLIDFYHKHYTPNNCTILISGPVDNLILNLLNEYFGDFWKENSNKKSFIQENHPTSGLFNIKRTNALQSTIFIGNHIIPYQHPDYMAFKLLHIVFGGFFGSRLMRNIREDKGYTYGIYSTIHLYQQASIFLIKVDTATETTNLTIKEIEKEINIIKNELIAESELNLVKNYAIGNFMHSIDGVYNQTDCFTNLLFGNTGLKMYVENFKKMMHTSPETLQKIANQYLNFDSMLKVVVGNI